MMHDDEHEALKTSTNPVFVAERYGGEMEEVKGAGKGTAADGRALDNSEGEGRGCAITDHTLDFMRWRKIPFTRKNYLHIEYFGTPPEELGGDLEAEIDAVFAEHDSAFLARRELKPRRMTSDHRFQ